jgi:hypothetical protein
MTKADGDRFERALHAHFHKSATSGYDAEAAAVDRILRRLAAQPLPRQLRPWRLWPGLLLDWDYAPAWPRLAALAGCILLGFALGLASPARWSEPAAMASRIDLAAVVTEPEPLTDMLP